MKLKSNCQNLVKLSVSKLAKLKNPHSKLYKAVLINNAFKQLQKPVKFGADTVVRFAPDDLMRQEEKDAPAKDSKQDIVKDISEEALETEDIKDTDYLPLCTGELSVTHVSPYSYNSFLSDVYKIVTKKFRRKM